MEDQKKVYTEAMICDCLNSKYNGNSRYKLANAYIFKEDWESDFFVQKENGYCYEFEVKISRSDFFSDKKKVSKHLILATGKYQHANITINKNCTSREDRWLTEYIEKEHATRPNKFYYVVPEGMIKPDEVPVYAGLMYFTGFDIVTVKEAPFIHKNKIDFEKTLCRKFYAYWLQVKFDLRVTKQELEYHKKKNEKDVHNQKNSL